MKYIILTQSLIDGQKLKSDITECDIAMKDIQCFVKEDIVSSRDLFKDVEYIFSTWYMPTFTEEEIPVLFPSLKSVFYAAGTVKYFAGPFLRNNIHVFSAETANGIPVAEFVAAQVILANKGYFLAQHSYKSIFWGLNFRWSRRYAISHCGNYGAKIGLIGLGAVGRQVAKFLQSYRLSVFAYDPYVDDSVFAELGVKRKDIREIFVECDVISNHLPDIPSTKGMLDFKLFSQMKDNVTFINTGRGAQVVERDLAKALRKRKRACAVLDVTRHEPLFPWSPLLRNTKVFITPHIAGSLANEGRRLSDVMIRAYKDFIVGKSNEFEVVLSQLSNKA